MAPYRVLVTARSFGRHDPEAKERLEAAGCQVVCKQAGRPLSEEELAAEIPGFDAVIVGADHVTERVLEAADRLKVVAMHGVGVDRIDVAAAHRRGVVVANVPGASAEAVAELAVALMLAAARHLIVAHRRTQKGQWKPLLGRTVGGKLLGLVGLGRIGKEVARKAKGLGMEVVAYDPVQDRAFAREIGLRYVELGQVLSDSDFISLHVPLLPETRRMIGTRELSMMKPTAILVNTSRGGLIDEGALAEALREGRLYGAALDVFEQEPPPPDHPLLHLDTCLTTPHQGAHTCESVAEVSRITAENVISVLQGRPPLHAVEP